MNPEQYRRAGEIYHAALNLPVERQAEFLARSCAGDDELRRDVESLLAAHGEADDFIETPPASVNTLLESILHVSPPASERVLGRGDLLGRYQIIDLLGTGGMGTVYRALDPSLGREVAIKALAGTFRGDAASLRRFAREARVLATLSHPNIATIYGFEQLDGSPYLVLERVEGETLAHRLGRGRMPVDEARDVGAQVAAGLEEAHGKGVIHRDLKPSNVMLTRDGWVKLVDFGLAKTFGARPALDGADEPITAVGLALGTARYMSPEQIKGDTVDTRTDVWAFGCVLYEMLTARPAFPARSVTEVVASVLRDDTDWRALPVAMPRGIHRLIRRCLQRDVRSRLQHIGDARLDLIEVEDDVKATAPHGRSTTWLRAGALAVGMAIVAALVTPFVMRQSQTAPDTPRAQLSVELPAHISLADEFPAPFAIAPSSSSIVLEAVEGNTQRLYVRELTSSSLRALPGTEGARQPFFSPDGGWVGFFANRKLAKVPVAGGAVLQLADIGGNPRGATWLPDGTIVVAATQTSGLARVSGSGGKLAPLTVPDPARGESSHRWPDVLPGGKWVLFTVGLEDASFDEARIEAVSIETGERRPVVAGAGYARYVANGRLLFVRGGRLHAVGFDPARLVIQGTPAVVLEPVRYDWRNGGAHLTASAEGALLYAPGEASSSEYYLSWSDREGRLTRATDTPRAFRDIKLSQDGRRIAAVIGTSTESDLWVVDANGTLSRLSFDLSPHRPAWTANGSGIAVGAEKSGKWRLLTLGADGKQNQVVLFESARRLYPNAWSHDGRYLVFQENRPESGWDLRVLEVDASGRPVGTPHTFADTPFHESSAAISFDGRWLAYESDELDGVVEVYVRSFPDGEHKVRASPAGARWPTWDAKGNLYYWQTGDNSLQALRTHEQRGQMMMGTPQSVWVGALHSAMLKRVVITVAGARYDLEPRGTRFLVLENTTPRLGPPLSHPMIVFGWH